MKQLAQEIIKETKQKESHALHFPLIKRVFEELESTYLELDIEKGEGIKFRVQRIQIRVLLDALTEMVASVITLLDSKMYSGVDPLARVAMEHAVNVMYLAGTKENARSKQLIKHYIETTLNKSQHWYKFAKSRSDDEVADIALKKLNYLRKIKEGHKGFYEHSVGRWPNSFRRFKSVGCEDEYVTLYSMNSDSVHSLSEDVYNFCTVDNYPLELQEHVVRNLRALNLSMSVYLGMKTVGFYALALDKVINLLKSDHDVFKSLSKLDEIALEHESENFERWS